MIRKHITFYGHIQGVWLDIVYYRSDHWSYHDVGVIDGYFGDVTLEAVKAFLFMDNGSGHSI